MDPSSRRQLWKIISNARSRTAIVLTTHAMDEAELLCNRIGRDFQLESLEIGIVAKGELRCLGTPLHLKNKFAEVFSR